MKSYLSQENMQDAYESGDLQCAENNDVASLNVSWARVRRLASVFSVAIAATMLSGCKKSQEDPCVALNEEGKQEDAIRCCDRELELRPDDVKALNKKGFVLFKQGDLEGAIKYFDRALELKPDFADALNNKGLVSYEQGKLEEAQKDQSMDQSKWGEANKHHNQAQGKLVEATGYFDRALALKPDYADALHNKGLVLAEQGKPDEAISYYDRALELKPDRAYIVCFHKCLALQKQGKPGDAVNCYDEMLDLKPDDNYASNAWNNKGKVAADAGALEQALFCYDRALSFKRDNPEAFHNKCVALRLLGRDAAATNCFRGYRSMVNGK
jgi:tetratricopeptide (TPR) repeat protein